MHLVRTTVAERGLPMPAIPEPAPFDADGFPIHVEGAGVAAPGLFFVGVHFLRKRKSSLLWGVGEDAAIVANAIAATAHRRS